MARLPLQTLPAFEAVARLQNLRQAADELHLTASAISQQIRLLEQQLGHPLFDRRGRRVVLNPAGAALQAAVQLALQQLQDGQRQAAEAARGESHRLRVTMLNSLAQRWLLPRMAAWRAAHPQITLELHVTQRVVDLVREGFHVALRQGQGPWKGLVAERLFESPLVAVGSPAAAARLQRASPADLAQEPLLGEPAIWARWFALHGHAEPIRTVASFNDAALMLQAAEQDLGIALAREVLAADALHSGQLVRLAQRSLALRDAYPYWLVYPPQLADWPPLLALRGWLQAELQRSLDELHPPVTATPAAPAARRRAFKAGTAAARR
jgi:LysR family transcriptional regulator, glycine cleavage system transcriptional activator